MACFANASLISTAPAVLISAYVAWVAYQQYRTNREKLRLDLYDRRFGVYTAAIDFCLTAIRRKPPFASRRASGVHQGCS